MFGSGKKVQGKNKRLGASSHESAVTILTPGCHFNGTLYCRGSSRIGGRIEGEIISEGLLIIEEEAYITATIKADDVIIQGKVKGSLEAKGKVELANGSRFDGDILTPALIVLEGAKFNGRSSMLLEEEQALVGVVPMGEHNKKKVKKDDSVTTGKDEEPGEKFDLTVM